MTEPKSTALLQHMHIRASLKMRICPAKWLQTVVLVILCNSDRLHLFPA